MILNSTWVWGYFGHRGRGTFQNSFLVHRQYISQNPLDIVGVHCTHGFNRTGFLISAFMIEEHDWSVDIAVQEFRQARAPGIYKGDYLRDIYVRYWQF